MSIGSLTKPEVKTVLGIDASTNSLAFCLYDVTGPVKWGELKFVGKTVFERLHYGQELTRLFVEQQNIVPDIIVFESAIFVQNKKTVILLAYAFGALVSALMNTGAKVEEISPLTWQNAIGNKSLTKIEKEKIQKATPGKSVSWYQTKYRELRKQRTMDWVENKYGISAQNDNVSDAIAIASVGYVKYSS